MPEPRAGEEKSDYISRCVKVVMGEGKTREQALGQCYGMWSSAHDSLKVLDSLSGSIRGLYPPDHQVGMEVPAGGSSCARCRFWNGECQEKRFVEWNGSGRIPTTPDRYCCDFFEAGAVSDSLGRLRKVRDSVTLIASNPPKKITPEMVDLKELFWLGEARVCEVSGQLLRDIFLGFPHPDDPMGFVLGGHHYRYHWMPEPDIWLIRESPVRDKVITCFFHEYPERRVMKYHGWDYDTAHAALADLTEHLVRLGGVPLIEALCAFWEEVAA